MDVGNKILVVCIGNICRSPAAEGFIATHFKNKSSDVKVSSAGIHALVNNPPERHTQEIMRDSYAIDVSDHRARQITDEMIRYHNLILVMEDEQATYLKRKYPFCSGKVYRIGKWRQVDIADPYKQSEDVFRSCISLIHDCVNDWIKKFW